MENKAQKQQRRKLSKLFTPALAERALFDIDVDAYDYELEAKFILATCTPK